MRLPRTPLLRRLAGSDGPGVTLLEAPSGYGKSWLARRAAGPDAVRMRGSIGALSVDRGATVVVDDAHALPPDDIARLADHMEDAASSTRLIIAGRILADGIHDAAQLVDGTIVDADALAVSADELLAEMVPTAATLAQRLVEAADGSIRVIATAIDQSHRDPAADPVALASRMVRAASSAAAQRLTVKESAVVGLLARVPGLDRHLLDRLAGAGFVERAALAGIPLRRQVTGGLDLAAAASFRSAPVDSEAAGSLAAELFERGRSIEAIGLLLDAGRHEQASRLVMELSESIIDTVEPRLLLSLLARLGSSAEREPVLLLRRASATWAIGRVDDATADIDRAVALAADGPPALQRRVAVEAARARLAEGHHAEAVAAAERALVDLGDGEEQTFARAHEVLAESAATSDARADLQRAAESYHIAVSAWEGCGEFARARACRRDLAASVFVPLGRYDEALTQIGQLLGTAELSDAERSTTVLIEGFVLFNSNRLESAESRFVRVTDLGFVHDNPRLIAMAAWGRALVASRRGDLDTTLRWIIAAENTALTDADDVLGVPFLCDVATVLGALGELELAGLYLGRAAERRSVFPDQVASTAFVLDARRGVLGDVAAGLACTPPAEWWRVQLVAAYASARRGEIERARQLLNTSSRELVALGFSSAAALGEERLYHELHTLLQRAPVGGAPALVLPPPPGTLRRLIVIGEPISARIGEVDTAIPAGNPQRLVGVIVANGGSATFDQLSDAIWPGEDVDTSRARLRNVLMRLRRAVGEIVVRSGSGVRLAPDVTCDLHDFERKATDALGSARADPELAGRLASEAVALADGTVFVDFEYQEWALTARRAAEQQLINLLDLLSVQAEDAGDLPLAQSFAERALRLDRYADSRYVRLAELLTLQHRVAAAIAVLDDAAEVARELGDALPIEAREWRDDLVKKAAIGG